MAVDRRACIESAGAILDHLAIDGKKTIVAVGLVVIMAFMWIRVLTGNRPSSAAADAVPIAAVGPKTPRKPQFVELPELPGRNDSIFRNFFVVQDRTLFQSAPAASTGTEVRTSSANNGQEVVHRAAGKLKLEAVLWSDNPQAFVNDQLLRVGDQFTVKEGAVSLVFEVVRIYEDSVLLACNDTQLTLKMAQYLDVRK